MPQILNEDGSVSKMCLVRSYENYIAHLNERCPFLWQTPNDAAYKKGEAVWYKNKRLGEGNLGAFMTELCKHVTLKNKYTNHCLRVTGTTNLTRCNFTSKQIMSVTGHKSLQSLSMYQRVKSDEKMMMGMSLAYSLFNPVAVRNALENVPNFEVELPQPQAMVSAQGKINPENAKPTGSNLLPLENVIDPYIPPQESSNKEELNFDLMEIISEVNDDELLLAASQMEADYDKKVTTNKMAFIKKTTPPEMSASPFAHCRIGSIGTININIYKK